MSDNAVEHLRAYLEASRKAGWPWRARLLEYVRDYAETVWPDLPIPVPSESDLRSMQVRTDGYANAHVEGEHAANGICRWATARECGERSAAAEFVECN